MKVLIVVTHLLGTGHLARALTLGRAFGDAGHAVTLASGGCPAPHLDASGLDFVQLPPLRSDGVNFTRLLTPDNGVADDRYLEARIKQLMTCLADPPDLVLTELFPFGRRVLAREFQALLDRVADTVPRPRLFVSIRDILAPPSRPEKAVRTTEIVTRHYDGVLVHSDPDIVPLSTSWPVSPDLSALVRYTGYVAPPAPVPSADPTGSDEVIVSAGGGPVGDALFDTALGAAAGDAGRRWRLLVGGGDAERLARLQQQAPDNAIVEPARPDFRSLLCRAAASISFCGYNTALDLLQTGVRAVIVPFDAGAEVEQSLRADALAALPGIIAVKSRDLSAGTLTEALARLKTERPRPTNLVRMDGARRTVEICETAVGSVT